MKDIDHMTQQKIREWQDRRAEVKDQMQLHPEKTLALSRVLDLMDEEHAEILGGSKDNETDGAHMQGAALDRSAATERLALPDAGRFELHLCVASERPEDLRRLLETAVHELQRQIDGYGAEAKGEQRECSGSMSGTLGSYYFKLGVGGEGSNE